MLNVVLAIVSKFGRVMARLGGNALRGGTVQLDGKKLQLSRIVLVRREEHGAGVLVDAVDAQHLVVAAIQLAFQLGLGSQRIAAVKGVEINMSVSVAPA